jgi:retinol-binding protein 3
VGGQQRGRIHQFEDPASEVNGRLLDGLRPILVQLLCFNNPSNELSLANMLERQDFVGATLTIQSRRPFMSRLFRHLGLPAAILVSCLPLAAAQTPPAAAPPALDSKERKEAIDGILEKIEANYVFPEMGKQMAKAVRNRLEKKEYDRITNGKEMAEVLTKDLRELCKDLHLRVRYSPTPIMDHNPDPAIRRMDKEMARKNYGFKKVELLGTNGVGLLELEGFWDGEGVGDAAAAAMTFLSNSEAVIVDLRHNFGGSPETVILLCSYFFDQPTHLNDIYDRTTDSTRQYWSLPVVKGKKLIGKDLYVLTSNRTFSGAEEFAYNLQSQKRATIIGETTGGGAHPTMGFKVTEHFMVGIPIARSINPVTKTNWEGSGVKPDIAVPADRALHTARLTALKKLTEKFADDPEKAAEIKKEIESIQAELKEMKAKAEPSVAAYGNAAESEKLHQIVEEGHRKVTAAFKKGDMLAVASHYADDGTLYVPGSPKVHGRKAIDAYWQAVKGPKEWKLEATEIGGTTDAIYEIGKSTVTTEIDGKERTFACNYIVIWKRQKDGSYRIHHDMFT